MPSQPASQEAAGVRPLRWSLAEAFLGIGTYRTLVVRLGAGTPPRPPRGRGAAPLDVGRRRCLRSVLRRPRVGGGAALARCFALGAAPPKVHAAWPGGEYAPLDAVLECAVPPKVPFALVLTLAAVARALCRRGALSGRRRGCARWSLSRWHGRVHRRFRAFMARGVFDRRDARVDATRRNVLRLRNRESRRVVRGGGRRHGSHCLGVPRRNVPLAGRQRRYPGKELERGEARSRVRATDARASMRRELHPSLLSASSARVWRERARLARLAS